MNVHYKIRECKFSLVKRFDAEARKTSLTTATLLFHTSQYNSTVLKEV
jgi:hypothetical protein